MPTNFRPANPANPFADYSASRLFELLSSFTLQREPGTQYEYSNLGAGFLGFVLAHRAGTTYEALLTERILAPLGLADTRVALTPTLRPRLATGFNNDNDSIAPWEWDALAGGGALRSTARDLLTFLAANMADTRDALHTALQGTQSMRNEVFSGDSVGLGWHSGRRNPGAPTQWLPRNVVLIQHSGQTDGYSTFMGFDPARRVGVVVLANSTHTIRDIGLHLLDQDSPIYNRPPVWPRETAVDQALLQQYVGEYEFSPRERTTVTRVGSRLYTQVSGQARYGVFPRNDSTFFWKIVQAEMTFRRDSSGAVAYLEMKQGGRESAARKIR